MNESKIEQIKQYWEDKALELGQDRRATTPDYWLREIEISHLSRIIGEYDRDLHILDIGCGNGYSTLQLLKQHPRHRYCGGDYSESMLLAAKKNAQEIDSSLQEHIQFKQLDVLQLSSQSSLFDIIISDRCLINLPESNAQWKAIDQIYRLLKPGGEYIAIENFMGGQNGMNTQRENIGLPPIPVRWHNCYFVEDEFIQYCSRDFKILEFLPISSTYYLLTRVVYSKQCQNDNREPDYDNDIYLSALQLILNG